MTRPDDDGQGCGGALPGGEEAAESAGVAGGEPAAAAGEEERGPSDDELLRALEGTIRRVMGRLDG